MSPAPGPLSPPAIVEAATQQPAVSSTTNFESHDAVEDAVPGAVSIAPKTCPCCGGLLDVPIESSNGGSGGDGSGADSAHRTADLARDLSTIGLRVHYGREPVAETTTALEDVRQVEQDRSQLCASCTLSRERQQQQTNVSLAQSSQNSASDDAGDTIMSSQSSRRPSLPRSNSIAESSSFSTSQSTAIAPPTTPTHPWRRQAPWTIDRSRSSEATTFPSRGEPQLTISTRGIGAGGDAVHGAVDVDDQDFPPLERSPSSSGNAFTATSPRIPLSPTRMRGSYTSNVPQSPPALGRQPSFSRSQNSASAGSSTATASLPIVNVPGRGRVRAGSASGQIISASQAAGRGRRTSTTRRLSRSSSSQGPTAVSFADLASTGQGSALIDDTLRTTPIEEDPFGPRSMTRPRLSALLAHDAKKEGTHAMGEYKRVAFDYRRKPFVQPALQIKRDPGIDCETEEEEEAVEEQRNRVRYLVFTDCSRPDPRLDISLTRSDPVRRGCLYPGATFRGTQKSGRTSYDVSVQIVNVDLAASHLCGYLNIRGLTDDWPELTTYFDAEIIGQRYGFLTGKWGATEADDMKHWGRFTPFRPMRSTLTRPGLRFNHMNKPYVFMRWKERFLVPDHRVRDISGASFAGFYYVCVELGEETETVSQSLTSPASPVSSPGAPPMRGRADTMDSGGFGGSGDVVMGGTGASADPATQPASFFNVPDVSPSTSGRMSGFYFHEHSEPYQQLTLRHVSESSSSTFELR